MGKPNNSKHLQGCQCHHQFIEDLKKVNDRKSWADHESGNTHKHFWIRAAMAYNNRQDDDVVDDGSMEHTAVAIPEDNESTMEDEFATLIVSYKDPVRADLDTNDEVNLAQFEQMETNAFQKKCLDLFKVWSIMQENMTKSGTHNSDPYNFVEVAMRGFTGLTLISVFYFYKQCDTSKTVLFDQMDMMVQQGSQLLELLKMSVEEQKLE